MKDVHKLVRLGDEIEKCGGDPKLLLQKLDSNLTLSEQNLHLERTLQGVKDRIGKSLEEERAALMRRDDAVEAWKDAEKQLKATSEKLAVMLGAEPEANKIIEGINQAKNKLTDLKQEAADIERYIAPGRWVLCTVFDRPDLFRRYRDLLNVPPPRHGYTEKIGQEIIQLAISEVQKHGDLVPKNKYIQASLAADNLKRRLNMVLDSLRDPSTWTREQRQALLGVLVDSGLTKENFEQFKSQLAISWRKCPIHKDIDLKVSSRTLKFECTYPGCTYTE